MYNQTLSVNDGYISKLTACCEATAGYKSEIDDAPQVPTIPPKDIMKQTIDMYVKTVNSLMDQGYPKAMADAAARQYILGGK